MVSSLELLLAHPDIARLSRALAARPGRRVESEGAMRLAAIALVLRLGSAGDPELLMIKRAEAKNMEKPHDVDYLERALKPKSRRKGGTSLEDE